MTQVQRGIDAGRAKQRPRPPICEELNGFLRLVSGLPGDKLSCRLEGRGVPELCYLDRDMHILVEIRRSGRAERSFQLWNLLNLTFWFDHWIAGDPIDQTSAESAG